MNGYELSRSFFDWCFEHPDKIRPNHIALYFFIIEQCNRLGWKEKFGLPTSIAEEAIGIKSYNTYIKTLNDLVEFGFIKIIEKSKNQFTSNIIALSKIDKAHNKALDKALIKHGTKQGESTEQSIDSINKQRTIKPENKENSPSSQKDKIDFKILVDYYHEKCPDLPKVRELTESRKRAIKARIKEHSKDTVAEVIRKAGQSKFLAGDNERNWTMPGFDWIFNPANFVKILEGAYDDGKCKSLRTQQKYTSKAETHSRECLYLTMTKQRNI
ncbi:MAG: hypothetical protein JXA77_01200 [Bacteroidales bacterium]|nr:hypothetical protein [Bacteroidales bacterium]